MDLQRSASLLLVSLDSGCIFVLCVRENDINGITTASIYIAELSQAETRGFFTGLTGVAVACGYTAAALMGLAFSYTANPNVQWRTPLGLSLVPSTGLLVALYFAPESPRFLLLKGKPEEAWKIVSTLHYDSADENQEYVREEFFQMRTQLEFDRTLDSSWIHMLRKPSYRKRTLMACLVTFLGQSTAVLVAAAYVSVQS
jgi:MFS family permease